MNTKLSAPFDVTRTTLAVLFISLLILASFWVVRPFISAFIWATTIVVILVSLLFGLYLYLVDLGLSWLVMGMSPR